MIHLSTLLTLLFAGAISLVMFSVKYEVQDLEDELSRLNRSIIAERQAIHVLKAEWSHLNNPERLRSLARRHLGLKPVEAKQFGIFSGLPKPSSLSEKRKSSSRQPSKMDPRAGGRRAGEPATRAKPAAAAKPRNPKGKGEHRPYRIGNSRNRNDAGHSHQLAEGKVSQ